MQIELRFKNEPTSIKAEIETTKTFEELTEESWKARTIEITGTNNGKQQISFRMRDILWIKHTKE